MKKMILCVLLLIAVSIVLFAEERNALLIANGKYQSFSSLANPVPEAEELKKVLKDLGFNVRIVTNASKEQMETAILEFQKKLSAEKGIGFFHYGGHAVQVNGENYLIPADADIPDEPRVSSRAVNVTEVMYSMRADTNIVILDSCRNNPLPSGSGRSASRGLQMAKVKPKNSIIVYSAQAGSVAQDGIFTPVLTEKLMENKDFITVLRDVRNEVDKRTAGRQMPGQYDETKNPIYLANVPGKSEKIAKEKALLEAELRARQAELDMARSAKDKENSQRELERVQAEAKRKELEYKKAQELEQKQKQAEQDAAKRQQEEAENQKRQQEELARMKKENEQKRLELERMKAEANNIDDYVRNANDLAAEIKLNKTNYAKAKDKAISETTAFYEKQKTKIVKDKYETQSEFEERKKDELEKLAREKEQSLTDIKNQHDRELKEIVDKLENQIWIIIHKDIERNLPSRCVVFGDFNVEKQQYPVTIYEDNMQDVLVKGTIDVFSTSVAERRKKCAVIESNIQSGGYVCVSASNVYFNEIINKYDKICRTATIREMNSKSNNPVVTFNVESYQQERTQTERAKAQKAAQAQAEANRKKAEVEKQKAAAERQKQAEQARQAEQSKRATIEHERLKTFVLVEGGNYQIERKVLVLTEKFSCNISAFYICTHEVTNAEYAAVMNIEYEDENKPVCGISWYDAIEYCNRLSMKEGLIPYYDIDKKKFDPNNSNKSDNIKWEVVINNKGNGYRLPTEAEWEYAALGGNKSRNYLYSGSDHVEQVAWHDTNSEKAIHDVMSLAPNELGLYDMSGNVAEWCWDWYGDRQNFLSSTVGKLKGLVSKDTDSNNNDASKDYLGASTGSERVVKGGSWDLAADKVTVSNRNKATPSDKNITTGFRVVLPKVKR